MLVSTLVRAVLVTGAVVALALDAPTWAVLVLATLPPSSAACSVPRSSPGCPR